MANSSVDGTRKWQNHELIFSNSLDPSWRKELLSVHHDLLVQSEAIADIEDSIDWWDREHHSRPNSAKSPCSMAWFAN